jgi:hypothetical protein
MDSSYKKVLIDRYISAYNAFDVEGMLVLLSPDIRFENYSEGLLTATANGIEEFRQLAESSKSLFSEREQRITAIRTGADSTIVDIAYRAVIAVDIPNGPPAGTVLDIYEQSEFSFTGGKISKIVDRS